MNPNRPYSTSAEEKKRQLDILQELQATAEQFQEQLQEGRLTTEMAGVFPSLLEAHFMQLARSLNYESTLTADYEERFRDLAAAHQRLAELEKQLGESRPLNGLGEQLTHLGDVVDDWWQDQGFSHTGESFFSRNGNLQIKCNCTLRDIDEHHVVNLQRQGYVVIWNSRDQEAVLPDNDINKQLLQELILLRFPGAIIHAFSSNYDSDYKGYPLHQVHVVIPYQVIAGQDS